jgi:hypothetical protein
VLYRLFPWVPGAGIAETGGPLHVPRLDQGDGRHDNPDAYGALYLSRVSISPIAERLRAVRGRTVTETDLRREGAALALVGIDDRSLDGLLDLDDPRNLAARELRPSSVATRNRESTRPMARALYDEGVAGFEWWSTIEASWINVTLFEDRSVEGLSVVGEPEPLTLDHPAVREAAEAVGVLLS